MTQQPNDSDPLRQDKQLWGRVMVVSNRLLDNFDLEVKSRQAMNDVFDTEILALIQDEILKARKETEKAFGGCTNCYGKGYATYNGEYRAHGMRWPDDRIKFCACERGKQLEDQLNQPNTNKEK